MMLRDLQQLLKDTGRYAGAIDGLFGPGSDQAIRKALADGPDTPLTGSDFSVSAVRLGVQPAAIRAFWQVEAAGAGFVAGLPKILPEPHRFSKNTGHRFDALYPTLSYPAWGSRYPKSQDERYDVLLAWVKMLSHVMQPVDAAFASASYGAPQIMGENFAACGYSDPVTFAIGMARDEPTQLRAFEGFVKSAGILPFLQKVNRDVNTWKPVAQRNNGTAYARNNYDGKMLAAFVNLGGV